MEGSDGKGRAPATPAEGSLPLRVVLKGQARQEVSSLEKVCPETRAPEGSAKELHLGFWVNHGFPGPVVDNTPAVGIVNVPRTREPSWA